MVKQVLKTVYELNEVKEKAIEENRYINVDFDDWYNFIFHDWKEKLEKIGFCNAEIYFSGFGSQGDGACFDCQPYYINLDLILNNLDFTDEEKEKIYNLKDCFNLTIEKNSYANHYSHEETRYVNIDYLDVENEEDENLIGCLSEKLEDLRCNLCKQIYKDLEKEYDYLTSDDAIYETLQANEYYFEENGKIARI